MIEILLLEIYTNIVINEHLYSPMAEITIRYSTKIYTKKA